MTSEQLYVTTEKAETEMHVITWKQCAAYCGVINRLVRLYHVSFVPPPTPGYAESRTSGWQAEGGFAFLPLTYLLRFPEQTRTVFHMPSICKLQAKRSLSCCKTIFAVPLPVSTAAFHLDRSDPAPPGGLSQGFINYVIISTRFRALITV